MIAVGCRIFMNEQLEWTLQATCAKCAHESIVTLQMGVPVQCFGCGTSIQVDPTKTVFHRASGAWYWQEGPSGRRP